MQYLKNIYIIIILIFFIVLTVSVDMKAVAGEEKTVYLSATEYDYPPFSVTDSGEADGFSVELLKAVAEEMGIDVTFKIDQWSVLKEELKNGELDILPLVGYTEERDEVYDFTVPYIVMRGNIFVRTGDQSIQSQEDLFGKEILVLDGDNSQEWALSIGLDSELTATTTYLEAFELLAGGQYDAVLAQGLVGEKLIRDNGLDNIEPVYIYGDGGVARQKLNLEGYEQKFCFAVVEGDNELLSILNEGLSIVSINGTYDELYQKWFPFLLDNEYVSRTDIIRYLSYILIPILVLLIAAYFIATRRTIKIRTNEIILEKERSEKYLNDLILYGKIFEASIENAPIPVMIHAEDGTVLNISKTWTNLTKYDKEDISTIYDWTEKAYGQKKEEVQDFIPKLYTLKETQHDGEFEVTTKGGRKLIWDFYSMHIGDLPDGRAIVMSAATDVTKRAQMVKQLKESEQRFKILHNASFGGIAVHDKGLILECNQGLSEITGYSIKELVGMDGLLLIAPDYRAFVMNKITSGYEGVYEVYGIRKNQEIYPLKLEARNMPYKGKQVRAVEFRDITTQKQIEEALQQSEEKFRVAQETSPDGFTILHPVRNESGEIIDFTWVYENQAVARTNQTDPQKVIGKRLLDIFPTHRGTSVFEAYIHVASTGESQILDEINVGEIISRPIWLRLVVVPMSEDIAILSQDISDRKLAENAAKENAFRFQALFNEMSAGAAIYEVLNDGKYGKDYIIKDFNNAALKAEGKEKGEVLGKSLYELRPNIDQYGLIEVFQGVWKTGEPAYYPTKLYVDEKFANWYENRVYKLPSGEIVAIFEDVTEKKQVEESLYEIERKHSKYVENAPIGVFVVNEKGEYIDVNTAATIITGYSSEELLKMSIRDIAAEESWKFAEEGFLTLLRTGVMSAEVQYIHKNGDKKWMSIDAVKLNENSSLGFVSDITNKKQEESKLLYISCHDYLTGLHNRRYYEQELKNFDTIEKLPLSIIMFDVNGLKLINDSFGHDSGDRLLKKTAETIKKVCREEDLVARIGGDEFVLLLPNTSAHESIKIAKQIMALASKEKVANIELSISYGYDTKTDEKQSIIEIIANAENHMYRHKLYERSSIRSKTIDLIMNTLFEKNNREAAHSNRVSIICQDIASKMDMDRDAINQMKIAGLIHDIGKIGINETTLNKTGSLTMDETSDIERHPEIGWRLLSSTNEFSELAQFVLSHHEKWDGSGYPNGLKGEAIPIEARIIAVADAYDAMTSKRSYRKAMTKNEAVQELVRCSGTQFDPEIVSVFLNKVMENR